MLKIAVAAVVVAAIIVVVALWAGRKAGEAFDDLED